MPSDNAPPAHSPMIVPCRPGRNATRSSRAADRFDQPDADPLGFRRVFTQVSHDLYGTKDVQDAIMATYVWMADQIGHLTLGLVPTLILGWLWAGVVGSDWWRVLLTLTSAAAVFGYWVYKEATDFHDTKARAGEIFFFDSGDILWNVKTALLYFGIGGALAVAAFVHWYWLIVTLIAALWPAYRVAFWWLRRKLAFQQAGLPYLYRLANFANALTAQVRDAVIGVANLEDRKISMLRVWFGRDAVPANRPAVRHLLITGPLGAGKTSLAVGIGTEFAFALGLGRYLTSAKLVQLAANRNASSSQMECSDGRNLWPWKQCELVIVDDVDAGVAMLDGTQARLVRPEDLVAALTVNGPDCLRWLGGRRSVWVLGDTAGAESWKAAIASLLGVDEAAILTVDLTPAG